jgi:hypothetical protein
LESFEVGEYVREDEMKERPELGQVILAKKY